MRSQFAVCAAVHQTGVELVLSPTYNFSPNSDGCMIFDAKPQASIQPLHKKTTVKELLMMRRQ
ncbi:hypothetical protein ILYODFUR_017071, partial [Ilyodon furcidens]